ncbi:MAG: Fe-S metabolism protein SufE [Halobacteriovoraceae bacterium]|nr:Fe-S metabolism protein SufE [Halobacteriovoraceae bacterium]|tara:strand:+ start:143724 stop:144182 length:459 start_codon:yes stop_codon:yes gene_type:complete
MQEPSKNSAVEQIIERFNQYSDWEDRYRELIKTGKSLNELDESQKIDKFKVRGCQSQVWLVPELKDGKVLFKADSDAVLVKGIVALLVEAYSGLTPEEITSQDTGFLKEIGITEHLSMNRTNGLANMVKQIKMYAIAFQSLIAKGVTNVPTL